MPAVLLFPLQIHPNNRFFQDFSSYTVHVSHSRICLKVSHHIRKNLGNSGKTYHHFKVRDGSSAGREMFYPCSQTVENKRRTADRIMSSQAKGLTPLCSK